MTTPRVGQVAFVHTGGSGLRDWYRDGLSLLPSGATVFGGPPAAKVNGLAWPLFPGQWLLDGQELFQLEFFHFLNPPTRARRPDETPADHGYRRIGVHVADFDATLASLRALGSVPVGPVLGTSGDRRTCVRDPNGTWVELFETDPLGPDATRKLRPEIPATIRTVTISVADLGAARAAWVDGVGLPVWSRGALHGPEHEQLWGLAGADCDHVVLDGGGVLIELVEYRSPPGRSLPADHRLSDQGIMNVAFAMRDRAEFDRTFARWVERGLRPTSPTALDVGIFRVMYFDLPSGQNVELFFPRRWGWALSGFAPSCGYVAEEVVVDAPVDAVWREITDHDAMGAWSTFAMRLVEPGEGDRNGLGALRRATLGGLTLDERVTAWQPPHRYTYRVEHGPLVRRHHGDILLSPEGDRTRVRWGIQLDLIVPGAGVPTAAVVARGVRETLQRLRHRCGQRAAG